MENRPDAGARNNVRRPEWLRKKMSLGAYAPLKKSLREKRLNTVCESARCPNIGECFGNRTATLMILGGTCNRTCSFCAVRTGRTSPPDPDEPRNVARMIRELGLKYAVITSVTRDDLPDGGAEQFAKTVRSIRAHCPGVRVELLVPDFCGDESALKTVLDERPDVLAHNVETVPSLYPGVRPQADFGRSLRLLAAVADYKIPAKSGIMTGLGESDEELLETMKILSENRLDILTLGQYLAPSRTHAPVDRYLDEAWFERMAKSARAMGIRRVFAGPYVRSSYMAERVFSS